MLRLPEFNYLQPRTLKQATEALADLGADAMLVAGGTDVYPKMKRGQFTPRNLISLRSLRELKGIRQSKDGLWIGAADGPLGWAMATGDSCGRSAALACAPTATGLSCR